MIDDIGIVARMRDDRRQEARIIRRLAERIARQCRKLEEEITSNRTEEARVSEILANATVIVKRTESLRGRADALRTQPSLI
jgi:K+/H+ antiporter YhaU regulatory subunit KhtT